MAEDEGGCEEKRGKLMKSVSHDSHSIHARARLGNTGRQEVMRCYNHLTVKCSSDHCNS